MSVCMTTCVPPQTVFPGAGVLGHEAVLLGSEHTGAAELSYTELHCSVLQLLFLALALSEITWRQDGRPRHPDLEAVELGVLAGSPTHFTS